MPPVNETNIIEISDNLANNIRERANWMKTKNLLYPWGYKFIAYKVRKKKKPLIMVILFRCDFQFHDAKAMFENMDKVLEYMQNNSRYSDILIKYSTLSEYFEGFFSFFFKKNFFYLNDHFMV